jgi:uncharacterized protein YgbK (DUF1537 family)
VAAPPPPWPGDPLPELAGRGAARPLVVLDDDPTGTQTLRDVNVLTAWDAAAIASNLDEPVLFLSTNSRALAEVDAVRVTADATRVARRAAELAGRPVSIVSRGDSTLRGHVPAEPIAVAEAIGRPDARFLLAPYFGDGGRLTVDDVHVLQRDGHRVPVGETEFARDRVFGYRSSNLAEWVTERWTAVGRPAPPTASLSLALVREGGPEALADALRGLADGTVAIANAEVDRDIEVVALGALLAEESGVALVARTAASYVRARAGRPPAPPLARDELETEGPGIVVVGSHVELTSRQLKRLLEADDLVSVELRVGPLLDGGRAATAAMDDAARAIDGGLAAGRTCVAWTERTRHDVGIDGGAAIASGLVGVLERVERRPGWVIGKGGITSHELASRALRMREARVVGQLLPGVPVWVGGAGARWPGVPLVVFPGNVGDEDALRRSVEILEGR